MRMYKKLISACMALLCMAALFLGSTAVYAAEEDSAAQETEAAVSEADYLKTYMEQFVTTVVQMDDPSVAAVEAWKTSKEEVGAFQELGETEVKEDDDEYVVTVPASFEKNNAEFEIVVNKKDGSINSAAFNVKYTLAENMKRAALNTVMGLGTVFLVLAFLMFVISLFKYIPNGSAKKEAPAPAPAPAAVAVPVAEAAVETDDSELIAVIAAAIAASEGTTTDGFVVRSIRKVNRRK